MNTKMEHFKIDLTEIEGEGDFPCPHCGEIISPDDDSGMVYDIIESTEADGELEKVTIKCKKCGSAIQLEGFSLFKEIGNSEKIFGIEDYLNLQEKFLSY